MADKTISDAGGNWSDAGCWVEGSKPTAAERVIATATSGAVTINEAAVCRSMDLTGYTSTLTHNGFTLTIGDGTAPDGLVALLLAGTYTIGSTSSSIVFTSTGAGVHTIDTGGKTIQVITFFDTGSYKFVTNNVTIVGTLAISKGTVDFNGLTFTLGIISSTGTNTRTLTFGNSTITQTTGGGTFSITGSNFTISNNSALFIFNAGLSSITFATVDGTDLNGASFKCIGGTGSFLLSNTCTIKNLIIDPTTTKTIAVTAGKTLTVTDSVHCIPTGGAVKFTGGSISKASGTVNLYQVDASSTTIFTGGATWNLRNNCTVTDAEVTTYGFTRVGGTSFIDYVNGSDSNFTAYGFYKVAYTGATGTCPVEGEVLHGETSSSTAIVSTISPYEWSTGVGTVYVASKSAAFTGETVHGNTGDGHLDIAADFTTAAWATINTGALIGRIAPDDVIRIAESELSTSIGAGVWTDQPATVPVSKSIITSTNSGGVINIHCHAHGFSTGDVVYIQDHAVALGANGCWIVTVSGVDDFTLDGSTYVADGGATGTATLVNRGVVKLTTAQTLTINQCEYAWTANAGGDAPTGVSAYTTDYKEGDACCRIVLDAATQINTMQAYYATGTLAGATMNGYQKLSFWFKNSSAVTYTNSTTFMWYIALCSDVAGATPIDTFPIPAIPSTNRWVPLTITRCDAAFSAGGNLGGNASTDVKSIAIYSGATAPTNSSTVYLDCFVACTTAGLNLQSLISKNTLAQGSASGTGYANEGWYAIQSISQDGKVLKLDNDTNTLANANIILRGMGYSGGTGSFTTYKRETIKTALAASSTTTVSEVLDSGVNGSNIEYQGGYCLTTGAQTGETFFDGLSGNGYGLYVSSRSYITLNYLCFSRYYYGVSFTSSSNNVITTVTNANNNNNYGVYFSNSFNNVITTVTNANNNNYYGVSFTSSSNNVITTVTNANNNNYGVYFTNSFNNVITTVTNANNNNNFGVSFSNSSNNVIRSCSSAGNSSGTLTSVYGGTNYIQNLINSESTEYVNGSPSVLDNSMIYCQNYKNLGYEKVFMNYATAITQASTLTNGSGKEWKIEVTNAARTSAYPVKFPIAKVYVAANAIVTVKLWMKKSHATNIIAGLVCMENQIAGLTTRQTALKDNNTTEEQVTLTLDKPTAAGVIEIEVQAYWGGATANVIFDKITISQG